MGYWVTEGKIQQFRLIKTAIFNILLVVQKERERKKNKENQPTNQTLSMFNIYNKTTNSQISLKFEGKKSLKNFWGERDGK